MPTPEEELYGDQFHLLFFRIFPESYAILIDSVTDTIKKREIAMPFLMAEVYGRHRFLGGLHYKRDPVLHLKSTPKWKANETEAEKAAREFAELYLTYGVDRRDVTLQRLLNDFAHYACQKGDFIDAGGKRYSLKVGGYEVDSLPREAASVFYQPDAVSKNGGLSRRGMVPHNKGIKKKPSN